MNMRAIAAVIGGIIAWWILFMAIGIAFGLIWPDYRAAARAFFNNQDFSQFTTAMKLANFVVFAIAGVIDGWLVAQLGRSRIAGIVVAGLYLAYALFDHYYLLWNVIPAWYNLVVPWIIAGSIFAGAHLAPGADTPASQASG